MGLPITKLASIFPLEKEVNPEIILQDCDFIELFFYRGKDSLACLLWILDEGVPREKITLHHHLIDGKGEDFMGWPVTGSYCKAVADAFGVNYQESWREGGFLGEMLRENQRTKPARFELEPGQLIAIGGTNGKLNTRRKFPQVSASLSVRWCSLKIDIGSAYLRNNDKFIGKKTLVITGERARIGF